MYGVRITHDLRPLIGELGAMSPAARAELRRGFRQAGAKALARAKANASWSSRIPAAISVRPMTGARSAGVFLRVNRERAPHARAYESLGTGARVFRHPVFADGEVGRNGWRWVAQESRPFIVPAVNASRDDAQRAALDAVTAAARVGRFH